MKKFVLSLFASSLSFFWYSYAVDISDYVSIFDPIVNVFSFIWSLIKFLYFWIKTIFNLVWKAFTYIFSPELFDFVWDTFNNLALFMWTPSAVVLMSLFLLAFLFIILWFVFRLVKWQVNYKTTIKKYLKK